MPYVYIIRNMGKKIITLIILILLITSCSPKVQKCTITQCDNNSDKVKDYYKNDYIPKLKAYYDKRIERLNQTIIKLEEDVNRVEREKYNIVKTHLSCMDAILTRPSRYIRIYRICPDCDYSLDCTGSMRPILSCKDTLEAFKPYKSEIRVCDIIASKDPTRKYDFIVHRIIAKNGSKYVTKGDNNMQSDEYLVDFEDIMFKIIGIEYG